MRLAFFGSPAAAVPTLERLRADGHELGVVVTQPDRPAGRGRVLTPCPVAARARALGLDVLQPTRLADPSFERAWQQVAAEAAIVVAYGRLIPAALLAGPRHGFLNVHFSLLPRHRGAAPVAAAILAGDERTGISIMRLDVGLDTGPVLDRIEVPLAGDERASALTERLAEIGAERLATVLGRLAAGEAVAAVPQDDSLATLCRPIRKDEGRVDWAEPAALLLRRLRAYDPWPGLYSTWNGLRIRVLEASADARPGAVGEVLDVGAAIRIGAGQGSLTITRLQPEGKAAMAAADFARGRDLQPGAKWG